MSTPYHVRLAISQYGDHFRAELFTEDLGDTEGDLLTELPPSIAEWVPYLAQGADLPPDAARQLGKDLFAALLGQPENAKKWAEVLTQADRKGQPVRLLIDATTEAVRDLPYGLLCEPHDDWFLFRGGKNHSVGFVRILRRCSPRPLKLRDRLRVLVAVAEPKGPDVPTFDAPQRLQMLAAALHKEIDLFLCGPDGARPLAQIAPDPGAAEAATFAPYTRTTREQLRRALAGEDRRGARGEPGDSPPEFDVFHLLAHGHGAGVLLCKGDGAPAETTAGELAEWCGAGRTALAFLQVCKAGQTAGRGGFGGVAQQLLSPRGGNLAAVVASTFPLDAEHSTHAAVGFYRQLAAGKPPEVALTAERAETDWCWAFLELWARPGALGGGTRQRAAFQFVSPYRGLSSFGEQDADLFFGRKSEVAELLQVLRSEPVLAVVGDSGSGKTSLLQAGLVHAVRREGLAGSDRWKIISLRPGYRPAQALLTALGASSTAPTPEALASALKIGAQPVMIVFDQFEELFTLARDRAEVQMLTDALAVAVTDQRTEFRLILGMRSEFLGQAASVSGLSRLIRRPWVLRPPSATDTRDIVGGPAEHCGYTFQGPLADGNPAHAVGLLDRICADPLLASDTGGTSSAPLPLLQFALERLWLKAVEKGATEFTHAVFDEIGGMGRAIAQHAEAVFQASSTATGAGAAGRALTEQIITALVSTRGTRQPRARDALQAETGNPEAARAVVDYLVGERLLTVRTDPEDMSKSLVDLSHEALIHNWDRLRGWLAEDPQGRAMREEFRTAAEKWESGFAGVQSKSRFALPGSDVARNYLAWIDTSKPRLSPVQQEFARALRAMLTRQRRLRRLVMVTLAALALGSGILALETRNKNTALGQTNTKLEEANTELGQTNTKLGEANTELGQSKAALTKANTELAQTVVKLGEAKDEAEGQLAEARLTPLASDPSPYLNDAEIVAFTAVAASSDERRSRFMTEALKPQWRRKLGARSEFALQAVVGLDARKRQEVERLLVGELERLDPADQSRTDFALAASGLGALSPAAAAVVAQALLEALPTTLLQALPTSAKPRFVAQALMAAAARLEPREAARVSAAAAAAFTQAMSKTNDPNTLQTLADGLVVVAPHLEPKDAATTATLLTRTITQSLSPLGLEPWAKALSAVAPRLTAADAAQTATALGRAMSRTILREALQAMAQCLSALAPRLDPKDAAAIADSLHRTVTDARTHPNIIHHHAQGLMAMTSRLEPREATRLATSAAVALTKVLRARMNEAPSLEGLTQALTALAPRLEPKEAAEVAVLLIPVIKTNPPFTLQYLAQALSALAGRLAPREAGAAATTLAQAVLKPLDPNVLQNLAQGLETVAPHLEPKEALAVATMFVQSMNDPNPLTSEYRVRGLVAVAPHLEPRDAAVLADTLTKGLSGYNYLTVSPLARGLSAVAGQLEPKDAASAAAVLTQTLAGRLNSPDDKLGDLAQCLSALAARLEPGDATRVCTEAAGVLTKAIPLAGKNNPNIAFARPSLAQGLMALVARMEPKDAARVCAEATASLADAITRVKTDSPWLLLPLAQSLSAVAARLEPKDAARISTEAAATLLQAMHTAVTKLNLEGVLLELGGGTIKLNVESVLAQSAQGVSALSAHMEPGDAARVSREAAAILTRAVNKDFRPFGATGRSGISESVKMLTQGLSALLRDDQRPGAGPGGLSDQELVELLKEPLCVGAARRAVLDQLGRRHKRTFTDLWDFLRFAEENKLGLNFARTPQRP
jgi:hypothetical protein